MIGSRPEVGTRVASYHPTYNFYEIVTVAKVTPTGQITAGGRRYMADGREITGNTTARELMPLTEWIEERVEVQKLIGQAKTELETALRHLQGAKLGDQALDGLSAAALRSLISSARAICPKGKS